MGDATEAEIAIWSEVVGKIAEANGVTTDEASEQLAGVIREHESRNDLFARAVVGLVATHGITVEQATAKIVGTLESYAATGAG